MTDTLAALHEKLHLAHDIYKSVETRICDTLTTYANSLITNDIVVDIKIKGFSDLFDGSRIYSDVRMFIRYKQDENFGGYNNLYISLNKEQSINHSTFGERDGSFIEWHVNYLKLILGMYKIRESVITLMNEQIAETGVAALYQDYKVLRDEFDRVEHAEKIAAAFKEEQLLQKRLFTIGQVYAILDYVYPNKFTTYKVTKVTDKTVFLTSDSTVKQIRKHLLLDLVKCGQVKFDT